MDDEEIRSLNLLKFKYRRGKQLIQPLCRVGSPQEITSLLFNLLNFKSLKKVLLNDAEYTGI